MNYQNKYIKYKTKYNLIKLQKGSGLSMENINRLLDNIKKI